MIPIDDDYYARPLVWRERVVARRAKRAAEQSGPARSILPGSFPFLDHATQGDLMREERAGFFPPEESNLRAVKP